MIVVTTDSIPNKQIIEVLGLVKGNTIRCVHAGADLMAYLRNLVGGEIVEYTAMIAQAREEALDRMIGQAAELGADGIVGMRLVTCEVVDGASEILAYGTAVRIR